MTRIGASSRVFAVLGDPVAHSLSPAMHNAAFAALGLDAVYVAFRVRPDDVPTVFAAFRVIGVAGNITVPLKLEAAQAVDVLTPRAQTLNAVNTFWCDETGKMTGDNTDLPGLLEALDALGASGPWLLAGTGGSARAVAAAARERHVGLLVRSRSVQRAERFVTWARDIGVDAMPDDGRPVKSAINATPVGLTDDGSPIPLERLAGAEVAFDLVYRRGETPWVRACRTAGLRAADGRTMLIAQAAHALERFVPGVHAPREVMAAAAARALR